MTALPRFRISDPGAAAAAPPNCSPTRDRIFHTWGFDPTAAGEPERPGPAIRLRRPAQCSGGDRRLGLRDPAVSRAQTELFGGLHGDRPGRCDSLQAASTVRPPAPAYVLRDRRGITDVRMTELAAINNPIQIPPSPLPYHL